jgi:hypothetical protein
VVDRKFTVHEGGGKGPPDRGTREARYHFQQMVIEILRALVRGHDAQSRITRHLDEFLGALPGPNTRPEVVVDESIAELSKELDHRNEQDPFEQERETIVLRALQVAAEAMAVDDGAKGRLGIRQRGLLEAIEHQFLRREMRREMRPRQQQAQRTPVTVEKLKRRRKVPKSKKPNPGEDTTPEGGK